jgi:2-methylaconitate cis-trans-isomerase PrpF
MMANIACAIIRGGTSKGVFLREDHLPCDPEERDALLLKIMGSPDPRQVDGLGGADPLTSKVAIVSRSTREGVDVEYESVEVGIAEARVNHGLMCGNLISGVGYFAMAEGLVEPRAPVTTVSIYCRSNRKIVMARMPVPAMAAAAVAVGGQERGASIIDGASCTVSLCFRDPGGAVTGKLLPAGGPLSCLTVGGRTLEVSIVDAGTLYAFARAEDFGLTAHETVSELDANTAFRAEIEALREQVAAHINQQRFFGAAVVVPHLVKVAIIGAAGDLSDVDEVGDKADIVARVINKAKVHKAYAVSGGICLAAAAAIPGTLVRRLACALTSPFTLRIAHPTGILSLATEWSIGNQGTLIQAAEIQRTTRLILRGNVYVAGAEMPGARAPGIGADAADKPATAPHAGYLVP